MYLEHFQLKEFPFLSSPDSRFLYLTNQVNETLQKRLYLISNRIGPLFCAGSIGTGKTTLTKRLHQQLENADLFRHPSEDNRQGAAAYADGRLVAHIQGLIALYRLAFSFLPAEQIEEGIARIGAAMRGV